MNNMQKAFKRKAGLQAAQKLADGGNPDPRMLGWGMARGAGEALQGRAARLRQAEDEAMGGAPAPVAPVAPAGAGGMSHIRDGATPPAGMLLAQRRGLADGGHPDPKILGTGMARGAGEALKGRAAQLARMEAEAMGEAPSQPAPQEPRRKGLADGGRASPELLGWGMARSAGRLLAGRGAQLAAAEDEAMGGAPAPVAPVAPAGAGGMSHIRDGATPPASMLLAQRRGLADGGLPPGYAPLTPEQQDEMAARVTRSNTPPNLTRFKTGTPYGHEAYMEIVNAGRRGEVADMRNTAQGVADQRAAAGLPNGAQIRQGLGMAPVRPYPRGYADGGRGNADEIETRHGGAVRGPGGQTDDKVGPVMLSDDEYVLPADTVDALGGTEALDQVRDATHEFVDEKNRPRGLADGGKRELVGPADPGWFAREQAMARTERAANDAVQAGTASHAQQVLHDRNQAALLDDPAVMNPLSELPGVGLASRGVSAAEAAAPGIISGLRAGVNKGVSYVTSKLGGAGAGALAKPAVPAAEALATGALPTAQRVGANVLATQALGADSPPGVSPAGMPGAFAPAGDAIPADQGSDRVTYAQAQGLSRGAPQAGKNYRLGGGQYSDSNADIFAGSTRADGTLNSFSGVGNGNRPNWEQRNPQDHQAALDRAASDKASVISLAVSHINEGTTDGLDRAYRLAAGDPEATAAVEAARQQYGLRKAAMSGNKEAGAILRQQSADANDLAVAGISAGATERVGLAKARADMAKAAQDQANWDKTHDLAVRTADRADGKSRRGFLMQSLEGKLGKQFDEHGNLSPAFAGFEASLRNTLQGRVTPDGQPLTVDNLPEQQLERLAQQYALNAKAQPGWFGNLWDKATGNDFPETNDLELTAPKKGGRATKRLFGGYSYKDERGKERRVDGDLTWEELEALGVPVRAQ